MRITPVIRISLGLVSLTISLLLLGKLANTRTRSKILPRRMVFLNCRIAPARTLTVRSSTPHS